MEEVQEFINTNNDNIEEVKKDDITLLKSSQTPTLSTNNSLNNIKSDILSNAIKMVDTDKTRDKHSKKLAEVADKSIETEIEMKEIEVEKQKAVNKVDKQEIKNRLYVLKQEHKRSVEEQKMLNKLQRIKIRADKKEAKWKTYGKSLEQLGYDYVPNFIVLSIVLFLVGAKAFFNGLNKVGNAVMKAFKWVFIIILVITVLLSFKTTREWLFGLLGIIQNTKV